MTAAKMRRIRHRVDKQAVEEIQRAIERIAQAGHRELYVSVDRAKRKIRTLKPTRNQLHLFHYLEKRGFISDEECYGINFSILGGLRNRHYVRDVVRGGKRGIIAQRPLFG